MDKMTKYTIIAPLIVIFFIMFICGSWYNNSLPIESFPIIIRVQSPNGSVNVLHTEECYDYKIIYTRDSSDIYLYTKPNRLIEVKPLSFPPGYLITPKWEKDIIDDTISSE